jgi:hypothetical protein
MELVIGGSLIALLFVGAALMKGRPTWVSAVIGWLAIWPLVLGAMVYRWSPARIPGGVVSTISSAVPLAVVLPVLSTLAGLLAFGSEAG